MTGYFINKRIAREWNAARKANFISYADAKQIVVLAEESYVSKLRDIACQWQKEGKDVTWVIYTRSALSVSLAGRTIPIRRRLGGWLPFPSAKDLELFNAVKPDTLIDLSQEKHAALRFLAAHSKAPMKIGIADTAQQNPPFDLIIRRNDAPAVDILLQDIIAYWAKISTKSNPEELPTRLSTDL